MMRRLTSNDMSKKKKIQDEAAPNFHIISIKNPLVTANASSTRHNNSNNQTTAAPIFSHRPSIGVVPPSPVNGSNLSTSAEAELVLLERFRCDIQKRMSSIVSNNNQNANNTNSFQNNTTFHNNNNRLDKAANLSATMMGQRMFAPAKHTASANDATFLKRQMLASLLAQTDMSKLLSLAVAANGAW
jgi:hypothetical protein